MTFARLAVLLLLVVGVTACGGDDEEASPSGAETTRPTAESPACVAVDTNLMTPLGIGMKDDEYRLKNGRAVQSADHENIYFVSAEIYGAEEAEGKIGTWATTSLGGAEAIWTVDDVAKQYSDFRDGTKVADLARRRRGVAASEECVEALG